PSDNVTLLVRYDAGGLTGAGQSFTGRTGPEVIDAALAAIEGEARPVEKTTVTEAEIMALSDDLVEIKRRCWYLRVEKGGDEWTVVAKEHRAGELATSSVLARGSGLVAVFNETREKLDRKVAATPR
ncbi:MAG: hypothetical protein ACYTJ0_12605, partial [Planctomycetota bacterium]